MRIEKEKVKEELKAQGKLNQEHTPNLIEDDYDEDLLFTGTN